jgi:hypothetical protein
VLHFLFFLSFALALLGGSAFAQDTVLPRGGIPPMQDDLVKQHLASTGKPCLAIQGYAKPELVNKNIYQHLIRAANNCSQIIKVKVCYYKTEDCITMTLPAYASKSSILGIFPALTRFRFEAKEQF